MPENTNTKGGARGTKIVTSTGLDNSSYAGADKKSLTGKMKGSVGDLSHSIKDGRVPND
jgi:hypothetical protein